MVAGRTPQEMKKIFPSHTPVQRGYHTDFLMASGNSVPTASSLSSLSTGAARFASGDTGSNSIVSSTAVSPPPSSTTSNIMRQFSAMPASPSVEANASDDDDDPLRRVVAVSSFATQVHVTVRGSRGGKPNISVTLSPFLRGLSTAIKKSIVVLIVRLAPGGEGLCRFYAKGGGHDGGPVRGSGKKISYLHGRSVPDGRPRGEG